MGINTEVIHSNGYVNFLMPFLDIFDTRFHIVFICITYYTFKQMNTVYMTNF